MQTRSDATDLAVAEGSQQAFIDTNKAGAKEAEGRANSAIGDGLVSLGTVDSRVTESKGAARSATAGAISDESQARYDVRTEDGKID